MRSPPGVLLMASGALLLPLVDGAAKELGSVHSPWMVGWARYAVAAGLLLPLLHRRLCGISRRELAGHLIRTALLAAAMTCYFLALQRIPLVTAASAYFVGPIIAMLLGIVVLGERLTRRKTVGGIGGLMGSWLVAGSVADIDPGVAMALAAGGLYAAYLVATRASTTPAVGPGPDALTTLTLQCLLATALLAPPAAVTWSTPTTGELWLFLVLGGLSVVCQGLVIAALAKAEASTLAPLVYLELVGSAAVGLLIFHEVPSLRGVLGAALIVVSGLYIAKPPTLREAYPRCPGTPPRRSTRPRARGLLREHPRDHEIDAVRRSWRASWTRS